MNAMEKVPDWITLWRQLVETPRWTRQASQQPGHDAWSSRARDFDAATRRKWEKPDPLRDFVASQVNSDTTVLDIGAGTGRWSICLAKICRRVTAVEPSPSMAAILRESMESEGVDNIDVVQCPWLGAEVARHDTSLCSHAMYTSPDLSAFVNHMVAATRKTCYLLLRIPAHNGIMGMVSKYLQGQPHDSANFVVAYNALLQMGIYANVLVEPSGRPWTSASLEEALGDLKRRLGLADEAEHDEYLMDLLKRHLTPRDGAYVWPDGMRSGLIYWHLT